jgi:serine O-acetyltransferase
VIRPIVQEPGARLDAPATTARLMLSDVAEMRRVQGRLSPAVAACVLYRLAHGAAERGRLGRVVSQALTLLSLLVTGAEIHASARIGPGLRIPHAVGITVGAGVVAGERLTLFGSTNLGAAHEDDRFPSLGDRVTLGAKASVLGDVRVGSDVFVGAHALVITDIPDGQTVVGVPARSHAVAGAP